jgi:hypothetical protein
MSSDRHMRNTQMMQGHTNGETRGGELQEHTNDGETKRGKLAPSTHLAKYYWHDIILFLSRSTIFLHFSIH